MTRKLTRGALFAEVHNVPDDYHFTAEELDRIIAGDLFTPRQGAIMARELQERRKAAMDSEPVADVVAWSSPNEERKCDIRWRRHDVEPGPLYRHAQQPVVPDEITSASAPEVFEVAAEAERLGLRGTYASYAVGWNACRAAMLQEAAGK